MTEPERPTTERVLRALRARANPRRAAATVLERPTSDELLGVPAAGVYAVANETVRRLRRAEADEVMAFADALVGTGVQEARIVGYYLVSRNRAARERLDRAALERLGRGLDNWAAVDAFGAFLSGPAWLRGSIRDADVRAWARSRDLWWRRIALVSTTVLNKKSYGGTGDTKRTLDICERLAGDPEDMIVKAVSWALRQLAPWAPAAVDAFLVEHDDVLAARVKREVRNKLRTGRK
jgi:3-methyladenine DNA glycosylase AlkD